MCNFYTFLVLRFSICCYKDSERETETDRQTDRQRHRETESEEREERLHSLAQSSGTLLEVIAKWVYKFKMLSSH